MTYADFHYYLTLALLAAPVIFMARWQASDFDRNVASDLREELDARMPRKESADVLDLPESELCKQLNAQQPLNFYRVLNLAGTERGQQVLHAFLKRLANRLGGEYLEPSIVTLLNGAARLSEPRPVLSMLLPEEKREVA